MIAKIKGVRKGDHIHADVFMGLDEGHFGKNGSLVFTIGEWQIFVSALLLGADRTQGHLTVEVEDPLALRSGS